MEKLLKKRREIDDNEAHDAILRDGQSIRVPLSMMDAAQLSVAKDALHKPGGGNPPAEATARREQASADYDRLISGAWEQGKPAAPATSNDVEAAYQQYDDRIQSAWKQGKA